MGDGGGDGYSWDGMVSGCVGCKAWGRSCVMYRTLFESDWREVLSSVVGTYFYAM